MHIQNYKSFYNSFNYLAKKTVNFKNNQSKKAIELSSGSLLNESSVFVSYTQREATLFFFFFKKADNSRHFEFVLAKFFFNCIKSNQFKKIAYSQTKQNLADFSFHIYIFQLISFYFFFCNSVKRWHSNISCFFSYSFLLKALNYNAHKNIVNFSRVERANFLVTLFSISQTSQFHLIPNIFKSILNKLSSKTKPFKSKLKYIKKPRYVYFSVVNFRRIGFWKKKQNSFLSKSLFSTVNFIKKVYKGNVVMHQQSRIASDYPKITIHTNSNYKKTKKLASYKSKTNDSILSIKSGSYYTKTSFNEYVPAVFSVKLCETNTNKGQPSYYGVSYLKSLLRLLTGRRSSLYRINAMSISRFAFDKETYIGAENKLFKKINVNTQLAGVKTASRFLMSLEREMLSRFRYVAVYIQDLIRISFFSIFLKKAAFLVSFFAFTLSKLPRNRKETQFIRFLMKLVKVFASQREEILGIRIRFQGRVNRWRRTKHIVGEKGSIAFYTYSTRIDYGSAQAITRKGALGIRFWVAYQSFFPKNLHTTLLQYAHQVKIVSLKNKLNFNISFS